MTADLLADDTTGMKTTISLPDDVCQRVARLAGSFGISRSQLFARALQEYLIEAFLDWVGGTCVVLCAALLVTQSAGCDERLSPRCGNGIIEIGESCDGNASTCTDYGYVSGDLTCDWCTYVGFEDCVACGNGIIDFLHQEQCDGTDLDGATCTLMGFYEGTLACTGGRYTPEACQFDTSACRGYCGDGIRQTAHAEVCDGTELNGATCVSQGYDDGILSCQSSCEAYDVSGCSP